MARPIVATIARTTLLEAFRNRLIWLAGIVIVAALGLGQFLNQVAVIESEQIQSVLLAALLRVAAVFIVVTFTLSSMVREANDKVTELMLSLPTPRSTYLMGKFAGFSLVAVIIALLFSLPLLAYVAPDRLWPWALSLASELLIMAAVSLFCAISLTQTLSALAAVAGFYLLSRSIAAMQIISGTALESDHSLGHEIVTGAINGIAFLLPSFDRMTLSGWLVDTQPSAAGLAAVLAQSAVYLTLITGASLFDLYRKNL